MKGIREKLELLLPLSERTLRAAQAEHEAERLAYLATLDPRQREMLDPD